MKNSYDEQIISAGGNELSYTDTGTGNAVLLLQQVPNRSVDDQLAVNFRVIDLEVRDAKVAQVAQALSSLLAQLDISKYSLIAESDLAAAAVAHAIESGDSVEALVLIAPMSGVLNGPSADLILEEVKAPTLVLYGTRDQVVSPETGRIFARRIAKCFYTLVYDAGHDIAADRPQALCAVVGDFLEHREKFVVQHERSVINP
jgi:pimeloyl-ACP methyl ester carboxylesterase